MMESVRMIIPNWMEKEKCSKPPTSYRQWSMTINNDVPSWCPQFQWGLEKWMRARWAGTATESLMVFGNKTQGKMNYGIRRPWNLGAPSFSQSLAGFPCPFGESKVQEQRWSAQQKRMPPKTGSNTKPRLVVHLNCLCVCSNLGPHMWYSLICRWL